jgi:radical SAM protein with 4Fe4S-binding SPASM domain
MPQNSYVKITDVNRFPRLPSNGSIDLTHRCNNNCRHCWIRIPPDASEENEELSFEEIRKIVDDAGNAGCRRWMISGGEPMFRPDFAEIFDYITSRSHSYLIHTNGALITPKIARLMRRKGAKIVALYGANSAVHDHITRSPGSFEATMRGLAYLKEAGARFIVQLVMMKDNHHQFQAMVRLAKSLSCLYRGSNAFLHLSACGDKTRNAEIVRQRLSPEMVVKLKEPDLSYWDWFRDDHSPGCRNGRAEKHLFYSCISNGNSFYIDPYGKMTFCFLVKDPAFLYDLKQGSFKEGWERFIPSLARRIKVTHTYKDNCESCDLKSECSWCPVFAYLEHRKLDEKINYLCKLTKKDRESKEQWSKGHRRYFRIADITVQVVSDLPIKENTFHEKFKLFQVESPGKDVISIRHHFKLPDLRNLDLGKELYRKTPWAIYKKGASWVYLGITPRRAGKLPYMAAVFNSDHTRGRIYTQRVKLYKKGNLHSLTLFPNDQVLLARILADRAGCYIHSSGVKFNNKGLLFVGHSGAGKSTMVTMLKGRAEILCDDRIIVRKGPEGFKMYGTWHHGDVPDVSSASAPLRAIIFLKKAGVNKLLRLEDKKEIAKRLLSCLITPLKTQDWWQKTLPIIDAMAQEVPCYILKFDKSGQVVELLKKL